MPERAIVELLVGRTARSHARIVRALGQVDEERARAWMTPTAPSLAFHAWHAARWADRLAAHLATLGSRRATAGPAGRQVWDAEGLASAWGFEEGRLGTSVTGLGMDGADARDLPMPPVEVVCGYARDAFAAAEAAMASLTDDDLRRRASGLYGREDSVLGMILGHLSHTDRHLGMTEALLGVMGETGSASG